MDKLVIICVDDQREVLTTLLKDLKPFEDYVNIEACENAEEAFDVLDEADADGNYVALVISDHIMPDKNGVEFLCDLHKDNRFVHTKKILLTGQATHQDTIEAINNANIQKYFEKPWKSAVLVETIKIMLTQFIIETGLEYSDYSAVLHQPTLFSMLKNK